MQNANSKAYSIASHIAIRSVKFRHFSTFNIVNCGTFKSSNDIFKSVIKDLQKNGKDNSQHHPPISGTDLQLLINSEVWDAAERAIDTYPRTLLLYKKTTKGTSIFPLHIMPRQKNIKMPEIRARSIIVATFSLNLTTQIAPLPVLKCISPFPP